MPWQSENPPPLTTREAFEKLTIAALKPLALILTPNPPARKGELVGLLAGAMSRPEQVRARYEGLAPLAQAAVQEAAHDPKGRLQDDRFRAKYGDEPPFYEPGPKRENWSYDYERHTRPTPLALFFPHSRQLPTDLHDLLLDFVPPPRAFALPARDEVPAAVEQTLTEWKDNRPVHRQAEVPLRVRETAREALHDLRAVLRLVEAGKVRVSDKKRQPTAASRQAVAAVLQGGDFYADEDQGEWEEDPAGDLAVKAFAWPMILQAAGLAQKAGDALEVTPAGRKALARPAHEAACAAWKKWQNNSLLDEFSRVEVIKGQKRGRLSAPAGRRKVIRDGLAQCPPGRWVAVDDFFRFLRATDRDFEVAYEVHELYIAEHYYGTLGYESAHEWEQLQGRYVLALLFEYAATLGLIDVAYLPPQGVRDDFGDRWGTDDLSCLSRYDGLLYFRLNALGAWCLGLAERYEPPALPTEDVLQVLPNLDVVARRPPLPAGDRLLLDRFGEPQSEAVWRLTADKVLHALEEGGSLGELTEFLDARGAGRLPQTVQVFLDDLRRRAGRVRDRGTVRLVECADAELARMLANDPQLRNRCQPAGERGLVFPAGEEAAVRKALRRLGYILPPQG